MDIGNLRSRVKIQTFEEEQQENTAKTLKTWTTIKTVWANVAPVKGYVTFDTKQIGEGGVTHKIIIRYQPFITTEHWILLESRRYRIRSVRDIEERKRYLELLCEVEFLATQSFEVDVNTVDNPLRELLE